MIDWDKYYVLLNNFLIDLNSRKFNEKIYNVIISRNGIKDFIYEYTSINDLYQTRSISKLISALCVGKLIDSQKYKIGNRVLDVDSCIWPIFQGNIKIHSLKNIEYFKKVTIKHLLTQSVGYDNNELLFSHAIKDIAPTKLLDYVFNEPIIHEPGKTFVYSNASAFILSVLFQELTGRSLHVYAQEKIFDPLLITQHSWEFYGEYCAGGTGLSLCNKDLNKLGNLILNGGIVNNISIISRTFIHEMVSPHVTIDSRYYKNPLMPHFYGYFMWIGKKPFYYINGRNGQYIIVSPISNTVISMQANIKETNTVLHLFSQII